MKLELKDVRYKDENYQPISAKLYINDVYAANISGRVSTQGDTCMESTRYLAVSEEGRGLLQQAEEYFLTQPDIVFAPRFGQPSVVWESTLESRIDELFVYYFDERDAIVFREIVDKEQIQGIVIGTRDEGHTMIETKRRIERMLTSAPGTVYLEDQLRFIKKMMEDMGLKNKLVLNNNIPENILINAGFKEGEYVKPMVQDHWITDAMRADVLKAKQEWKKNNGRKL